MSQKKQKIRVMISQTFDPWFNLATEDWIFRDMDPNVQTLFLWRNDNTVVIGRFQNPWTECNTQLMEENNIKLARRQSGGGAVFHDLGNTNFTFLSSKENFDKAANNRIITNALAHFGLTATPSGRNDIIVETAEGEKKISGSAFKETKDRSFHHGTLLINTDMTKLGKYLNPNVKKLQSKGITSVRARVANLNDLNTEITHELLSKQIIAEFCKHYEAETEIEILDHNYLETIPELKQYFAKLSDWNWRFGEAPQFTHQMTERFEWGLMEVHLDVHKAKIEKAKIFSDSLHPEMIEELNKAMEGILYTEEEIKAAIEKVANDLPMIKDYLEEFKNWIVQETK